MKVHPGREGALSTLLVRRQNRIVFQVSEMQEALLILTVARNLDMKATRPV